MRAIYRSSNTQSPNCSRNGFMTSPWANSDLNDHDRLPDDSLLGTVSGKADQHELLAGKSTLHRLELSTLC